MFTAEATTNAARQRWIPAGARHTAALEIALLAVILPTTLFQFSGPGFLHALLPMLTLIPVLVGVRYGFLGGTVAALLLAAELFEVFYFQPRVLSEFPKLHAALFLFAGTVAGQFRDQWAARFRDLQARANRDRIRLEQFTSTFRLLQVSHAQLERQLAGSTTSLRTSLQRLKFHLPTMPADASVRLGGIGPQLLELLAETCSLHAAAVYAIQRGLIDPVPVASIGAAADLSAFNRLLREALATGTVVSVHAHDTGVEQVIAVVPLIDSLGKIHGVVSVNQMLFIAIHQRTFDLMAIIASQIGDILASRDGMLSGATDSQALHHCLARGLASARRNCLPLAVVASKIVEPTKVAQLVTHCLEVHRGIDQSWLCRDRLGHPVIVTLLPMADENAAHSKVQRLRDHVALQYGSLIATQGIQNFVWMVNGDRCAEDILAMILQACDIQGPVSPLQDSDLFREVVS